ncbi:Hsp70 family protein [Pseudooceanicola algae]|uniref:Chaperone protein DnaK n=1 Tax=Pseudooceanicola algae TaxID=1537215 RepID=A0A418SEW8_9RHOB|nr:Hsp70 family protein [Pseudooceanicola algae]QPM89065.1 Chaperone protein DnaK [Pseudooceanicola algae]
MDGRVLAVDFGTSNSAAAVVEAGSIRRIAVEDGAETLPTAVFFPADEGTMLIGQAAAEALISGEEGRYMRALKSVLGTTLFHERRLIGGRRRTLADIVTAFLIRVKARSEAELGGKVSRVLSGRPVHFHDGDPARDAQAEADLRGCYEAAGFTDIRFLPEPEAAAWASMGRDRSGETGLIVDIGGGTTDFTVFRQGGNGVEVLASHGIRLGGTDFDAALSLAHVMPLLGQGGQLRRDMGAGLLPMPAGIFVELATWAKIPFLYTPETRRMVAGMLRQAVEPQKLRRLAEVLESELGHEMAFAVERGKIAANGAEQAEIALGVVEKGLVAEITRSSMDAALAAQRSALETSAAESLTIAGLRPGQISAVVLVGGSSLMGMVDDVVRALCPDARVERAAAFTAVVDGLALAAAEL